MMRGKKRVFSKSEDIEDDVGPFNGTLDYEPDDFENVPVTELPNNKKTIYYTSSHRSEMLTLKSIKFPDNRQQEFIPILNINNSSVMLDSSSDSNSGSSLKSSYKENSILSELNEDEFESETLNSITLDDENRLLESSDEEEEVAESDNFFKNKVVLAENNRIIIQANVANNNKELERNQNKNDREVPTKKKKKWDLSFNPAYSSVHLKLQDIGYISESDDETTQSLSRLDCSNHTVTTFEITCNETERICTQIDKIFSQSKSSLSSVDSDFKVPLPPVKRPPSRLRRQNSTNSNCDDIIPCENKSKVIRPFSKTIAIENYSESRHCKSTVVKQGKAKEDDSISLYASTLGSNDNREDVDDLIRENRVSSNNLEQLDMKQQEDYLGERMPFVQNWVANVQNEHFSELDINMDTHQTQEQQVSVLAAENQPTEHATVDVDGKPRFYFKDVPRFFLGLCYYHYLNGTCKRKNCNRKHLVVKDMFVNKCKLTSSEDLLHAYRFSLKLDTLYKDIHLCFVEGFAHHRMQRELIACIGDFFKFQNVINVPQAIEETVKSLEKTNLTFLEAVDKISFNVGFMQYPQLANILLELVTRKKKYISDNWEMIKRIFKATETIPVDIARRILLHSVWGPYNKKLCIEVFDLIIKNNATDLTQIEEHILAPFRTLECFKFSSNSREISDQSLLLSKDNTNSGIIDNMATFSRLSSPVTQVETLNIGSANSEFRVCNDDVDRQQVVTPRRHQVTCSSDTQEYVPLPNISINVERQLPQQERCSVDDDTTVDILNFMQWSPPVVDNFRNDETISKCDSVYSGPEFLEYYDLFPDQFVIGNRCYNKHYSRDISLHNLLCNPMDSVDMHEVDVKNLNTAIKMSLGKSFMELMRKYSRRETISNFITMTLAHLKNCAKINVLFDALLESLAQCEPNFVQIRTLKGILEVVVMNLLLEYEKLGLHKKAAILIEKFCDWDSLVSSKIFHKKQMTDMGKYLYLAKMLVLGKKFHLAYEILHCPNLHLLEPVEKWPYFCHSQNDLELRNTVFNYFFNRGFHYDIITILTMYKNIFKFGGISKYNVQKRFNQMLVTLLDKQLLSSLTHILSDIDLFYKEMDKNVFRAFAIVMESQVLLPENKLKLYEFCCHKNIYKFYKGDETNIVVQVNMLDTEIHLILLYFLKNVLAKPHPPSGDISIDIKLQDCIYEYPKMLVNTVRSIKEVNESVKTILYEVFKLPVINTDNYTSCEISVSALSTWWHSYKKWY